MKTPTAETIQSAMHQQGLKTYDEMAAELKAANLALNIEKLNKRGAQRVADRYEWRYKLWLTIALTTWVAVITWRVWVLLAN